MSRSRGRRFQNLAYGDDNRFDKAINHTLDYFPNDDSGEDGDHIVVKYESIYYYGRKVDGKWIYFRSLFNNRNEEKLTLQHPVWNTLRAPATEFRAASSGGATWNATYLGYSFSSSATNTVHLILPIGLRVQL